jgi:hypothetical protein
VTQVQIQRGRYRGREVAGVFELVMPWTQGARGGFVTIRNPAPAPGTPEVQRVACAREDIVVLGGTVAVTAPEGALALTTVPAVAAVDYEQALLSTETESEALDRIARSFVMLESITDDCARGLVRGLVVSGPPGIGKSYGVEKQLESANLFRKLEGKEPRYEIVSGGISPVNLFMKLYWNRHPDQVLVFDDCDEVLFDEDMLNMLKAALNSGDRRRICWNKESRVLAAEEIDKVFDFEGAVIFLSNIDFEKTIARGSRLSNHLEAIMSRCHYMDLSIGSMRDKMLRIRQVVRDGMLKNYEFTAVQEAMILDYIMENQDYLREVSLRMVKKIADFVRADPAGWLEKVEATVLTKEAKFKRLVQRRDYARRQGLELLTAE